MGLTPHGADRLPGEMLASRQWLPLQGAAGGRPGATTSLSIRRADGTVQRVSTSASGVVLSHDDLFEFACASGGGFGDPLDRDPGAVQADVRAGRLTAEEASSAYAVDFDEDGGVNAAASQELRDTARA